MSSDIYTLPELVDLALKTTEGEKPVEAVNFNILRVILHKILLECKLQNVTGEWKAPAVPTEMKELVVEEKLPDHPLLAKIAEKEEKTFESAADEVGTEVTTSKASEEKSIQTSEDLEKRDTIAVTQISESPLDKQKSDKEKIPEKVKETKKPLLSKETSKVTPTDPKLTKKPEISEPTTSKGLVSEGSMFQLWELKKLVKRVEAVEEELTAIVDTVDLLEEWKNAKTKRFQMIEGEWLESGYSGSTVGREEFEDTIDELGEALILIRMKQKEQKENCDTVSQEIINELNLRPTQEEMNESYEELKKKLNTLSKTFRNMQKLMKDVIFPEACGTTKCLSCKRKAHLPLSGMTIEYKKGVCDDSTKRKVSVTRGTKSSQDLRFTTACLKRIVGEAGKRNMHDEKISEALEPDEKDNHSEQYAVKEHPMHFDAIEVSKLSSDFPPLRPFPDLIRRDYIYIPSNRPKKAPVAISVGNTQAKTFIKKYPDK